MFFNKSYDTVIQMVHEFEQEIVQGEAQTTAMLIYLNLQ